MNEALASSRGSAEALGSEGWEICTGSCSSGERVRAEGFTGV